MSFVIMCKRCGSIRVDAKDKMCESCLSVEANMLKLEEDRERNACVCKVLIGGVILVTIVVVLWILGA